MPDKIIVQQTVHNPVAHTSNIDCAALVVRHHERSITTVTIASRRHIPVKGGDFFFQVIPKRHHLWRPPLALTKRFPSSSQRLNTNV